MYVVLNRVNGDVLEVSSKCDDTANMIGKITDKTVYYNSGQLRFVEVDPKYSVPADFAPHKYRYDETTGFTPNPNDVPVLLPEEQAKAADNKAVDLQKQMAKVLLALAKSNIKVV